MKIIYPNLLKIPATAKFAWIFAILFSLITSMSLGQTTLFNDNFNANNSATFSTTGAIGTYPNWSVTRSGNDWGARVNSNLLELSNDASATANAIGWVFGYRDINALSGWNTTLSSNTGTITWEFNIKANRSNLSGFSSGSYGLAFILAGTSTSGNNTGSGYALVLGNSSTPDPFRLVSYNNGLAGTQTAIITSNTTGFTDIAQNYYSVRVTYIPSGNTWELFLRDDGTTAFTDPTSGTALTSQGTAVNNTYTSTAGMRYIGGYWQGSTTATQTAFFDNIYLKKTSAELTPCNYSQDFNSMGTAGTAPPAGWNHFGVLGGNNSSWPSSSIIPASGSPSAASSGTLNNTLIVSTGSGVSSNTQAYNFGASGNSDRALGTSPTSDAGNILELTLDNATGASISSFNLSYDVRRFTGATNELPGYWIFVSSNNGSTWTEVSALRPTSTTVPNTVGVSNFGPTLVTLPAAVANGSPIKIRWVDDNANETSPDQIIGLDNVVISYGLTAATLGSALTTTYGTASTGVSFTATGLNVNGNITVTPQSNFEVSTTSATAGFGSAAVNVANNTTVWLRLSATAPAGTYDNVTAAVLSGGGSCSSVNVRTSGSGNSVLPALSSSTCNYSENFNSMGSSGTAPPAGWNQFGSLGGGNNSWSTSIPASGDPSAASGTLNNLLIVSDGSGSGDSQSQGFNFGATGNADRALGVWPTGRAGSILELTLANATGANVSSFNLSYDVRRFSVASSTNELPGYWVFVSSDNGSTWVEITALRPNITTVPNTVGVSNFGPVQVTLPAAVANGSPIKIRWVDDNANQSSPDQAIGLDNVVISYGLTAATLGSALTTTYGTASTGVSFIATGVNVSGNITVTPQSNFEVSTTSATAGFGTTAISVANNTTVWLRLRSTAPSGNYNGVTAAVLSGGGSCSNVNVSTSASSNTVSQRTLTITANNNSKTYGQSLTYGSGQTAFTSSGLQNGETIGSITITASGGTAANAAAGTYTLTPSAATGGTFTASNYSITYTTGTLTVNPATLNITAIGASKVYGNTLSTPVTGSSAFTSSGLQNGETIGSVTISYGTGAAATAAVGAYTGSVTVSAAIGGTFTASNYNITYSAATLTVTQATLTITANAVSKVYGNTLSTPVTGSSAFTSSGLQNGETIGSATISYGTGAAATAAVGAYIGSVTVSAATGGTFTASNYSITYTSATLTVTQATLTITANAVSKVYGNTLSTPVTGSSAFTSSGLQNGETIGSATISYGTGAAATAAVGTYLGSVTASAATGGTFTASNYSITYTAGQLTVTQATLTITASNVVKTEGNTLSTPVVGSTAFTSSGLQNGESIGTVTIAYGTGAAAGAAVGTYTGQVVASAATGGTFTAANYNIIYVAGDITVVASPEIQVSGTLSTVNTVYGTASPSPTQFSTQGSALTGNITVTPPAGYEISTSIGSGYSTSITLTATSGTVNPTTIYVRLAATTIPGTYSGNITVAGGSATTQTIATAASTVSPKVLTVSGLAANNNNKVYDRTTSASVTGTATLTGIVGSDVVSLGGTPSFVYAQFTVGTAIAITANGYTLSGANAGNYTLTQPGPFSGDITPKPITVSSAAVTSKTYDGNNSAVIIGSLSGVIAPDAVTFSGTGTFASANAGTHVVTSTSGISGADAANYSLTQPTGLSGTINPKVLSISPAPTIASKVYDATTTAGAVTVGTLSGLVGSETLTVTGAAANYSSANAGSYAGVVITYTLINGSGLAANYSLANGSATGVISPKALTITAPSIASKVYDATTTAGAVTVGSLSGFIGSQTVTVTGVAANYSSADVGSYAGVVITYTLSNGTNGGLAANYSLANGSATGVVTPKALTITSPTIASKAYDATTTAGAVTVGSLSGFVGSQTVTATATAVNYSSANVGTYTNVTVNYTLANGTNGGLAANYSLAAGTATGVITERALTITANNVTKDAGTIITGGSGSTAFTSSGLQGAQTIGSVTIAYGAAAGSTGQGATPGTYSGQVTASLATGGTFNASNYTITYVAGNIIVVNYSLTPAAGDIAFTCFQSSAPDGVEFITLRRIDMRNMKFTDNGILADNSLRTGEGTYTVPNTTEFADIPAGTIMRLDENVGVNDINAFDGVMQIFGNGTTVAGASNFQLSTSGDQVIAYTGSNPNPTYIAGITGADASANWSAGATSSNTSKAPGTLSDYYFSADDNGYLTLASTAVGNAAVLRNACLNGWTLSASAQSDRFNKKNLLFNESNYQSGALSFSGTSSNGFVLDASAISFANEAASSTRYAVVVNPSTAPSNPADRYTCYSGTLNDLSAEYNTDPTVVSSGVTEVCTGTNGSGKLVYLGYTKPTALIISGLTAGLTYHVSVYALNGNGWSANYSSSPATATHATSAVLPTITTNPTVTVNPSSVLAGGTVLADGGATVTERGLVWGYTSFPDLLDNDGTSTDGSGLGAFSGTILGLPPETQVFVRAYATNSVGTQYGNDAAFYTFSNQPTTQATNLIATPQSSSQINLAWDAAEYPFTGATQKSYALLRATAPQVPTLSSTNGQAPSAGVGTLVSANIVNPTTTFNNTGLASSTTYNYLLVPYSWNGVNAGTIHYLTSNAPTATATTEPPSCSQPTIQAANAAVGSIGQSGFTVTWTAGNGDRSLVVLRANAPVSAIPVDGTAYTGNAVFGNGTALASGEFAVYANNGSSVTISGLAASTTYYVSVFAYNTAGSCYLVSSSATASATTLPSTSIIETFEPGTKVSYTAANVTCNLGVWNFTDALIGTAAGSDRFNGTRSSRLINTGSISMQFDKTGGMGTVTVNHAAYGSDGSSTWQLEASTNGGASFDAFVSSVYTTSGTTLVPTVITLNIPGDVRIRIRKLSGGGNRINIDDIAFTGFTPSNTISTGTISGSPFCISNTADGSVTVPFTATGTFNEVNVFIAQLSNASGNFSTPIEIGTLNSSTAGSINAVIPAGTLNGTGYRIRVVSTSPEVTGAVNASNLAVYLNAPDASNFFANVINGSSVSLNWTNPGACFDELLIVAKQGSAPTASPSGNGSAYTANAAFATGGTNVGLPANEYAVYKNSAGSSVTVTGLTANTVYYFELFTRKGTLWSDGIIVSTIPFNPQTGDFQTAGSGNYSSTSTWQMYDGASWLPATEYPNQSGLTPGTATVTIRTGHTVVLDASRSSNPINNLIVQSGARIWAQDSTYNGNRYITVYGNITCNGFIGRGTNLYDNISFNIEGNPSTISGAGSFNASRIRKTFTANSNSEVIIAMNVGLKFASGVGTSSGTCLYNNVSGTSRFNLTVNENSNLSLYTSIGSSGNLSIDGIDGEGSNERHGTFTINGTLTIPGTLFAYTDNITQPIAYIIGTSGVVNCVNVCTANSARVAVASGSAAAGCTLRILNGGRLNLTGGNATDANTYNKPFSVRSNTVSPFTFNAGLGLSNNTFDFQAGSIVEYSGATGTMPVQSQNLTYSNLKISGAATKTINSTLNVTKNLTIVSPAVLSAATHTINLGGDWNNYAASGFTEGTSLMVMNGIAEQNIYCPGGETFNNLTISNPSTDGVILRTDVNVSTNLSLGSNGRLFFGSAPSVLSLTNMANGSTSLSGNGTSLIDMSGAPHIFNIGAEFPGFTGQFNAGNESTVNYYRSGGSQYVITGLSYHNLNFNGSDSKILLGSTQINGDWNIDGATVAISTEQANSIATFAGDINLSAGATMQANCFDNLSLLSTAQNAQTLRGNSNTIRCFNFTSHKSGSNGLSLAASTPLVIKNDLSWKHSGTGSVFADGGNTISLGDDAFITGAQERFNFTGTLLLTGENDPSNTLGNESNGMLEARLNNLTIQGSGAAGKTQLMPVAGGQSLFVNGNLSIENSNAVLPGILNPNGNSINLGGNWSNYNQSGFTEGTSEIRFIGTTQQTLTCNGGEMLYRAELNNANGLVINHPLQLRNRLNMQAGNLNAGANLVTLGESVGAPGTLVYASGRIIGAMKRWFAPAINTGNASGLFPIGNSSFEQFVKVEYTTAPTAGGTLTADFVEENMALSGVPTTTYSIAAVGACPGFNVSRLSQQGYWQIDDADGLNEGNYDISFDAEGFEIVNDICALTALKRVGSGDWLQSGTHVAATGNTLRPVVKRTGASGWSNWGFGGGGVNPLPIELLEFNAIANGDLVELSWITASEINNERFEVERSSNAQNFAKVATVAGAGNSNMLLSYSATDAQPLNGVSYYRLKQIDYNGSYAYSDIVPVVFAGNAVPSLVFAGIRSGVLELDFSLPLHNAKVSVFDLSGRLITSQQGNETAKMQLAADMLSEGVYLVSIESRELRTTRLVAGMR